MKYPYTLPSLPYAYDALEPYIDAMTMEIHYTKHHQTYINNLNELLRIHPSLQTVPLEKLLATVDQLPPEIRMTIRNHGGGTLNHDMFWTLMKKNGGGEPNGKVAEQIKADFGSLEACKERFNTVAKSVFGSGWAWLCIGADGRLLIHATANQDSPLSHGLQPIMGLDVWEHAYYLKYQNRRPDYITAWWHVINWEQIEENYRAIVE